MLIGTAVLAVAEALRVEGPELALGGDIEQPVAFDVGRTRRRRQQELAQAALHARRHVLPEERAVRGAEGHQHAALVPKRGVHLPGVVGPHVDRIAGHDGTAEGVVAQLDAPDDVPSGGRVPVDGRIARLIHGRPGLRRDGTRGHTRRAARLSWLDASDALQGPLRFVTQGAVVRGRGERLARGPCRRPDAAQRAGREDAHVEELVVQRADQLRHGGGRRRPDAGERLARRPPHAGNRIAHGPGQVRRRRGRRRSDGRQGFRRVDADVRFLVRERLDERADRRTGLRAERAQRAGGIARHFRILVPQGPSQRGLDRFRTRREVDEDIDGTAPQGHARITKQVHQQRNGGRADLPDDFERHQIEILVATAEESLQQRQRLTGPLHQGGFGAGPHLGVPGGEAGFPIAHLRRRGLGGCRDRQDAQQHAADEQVSHGRSRASMRV